MFLLLSAGAESNQRHPKGDALGKLRAVRSSSTIAPPLDTPFLREPLRLVHASSPGASGRVWSTRLPGSSDFAFASHAQVCTSTGERLGQTQVGAPIGLASLDSDEERRSSGVSEFSPQGGNE